MFMMQNMTETGVSFVFRASQGHGPQNFSAAMPPDPHIYLMRSHFAPPQTRDLAMPLVISYLLFKTVKHFPLFAKYGYTKDAVKQKGTEVQFSGCTVS